MTSTTNPHRVAAGVPTGGQFATSARSEADVDLFDLRREAQASALAAHQEAARQEALAQRIEAYSALAAYPDDHTIETVVWPEDINEDGTFDVSLATVSDADGHIVSNDLDVLVIPAGRIDGFHLSTDIDDWRTDPDNIHSPVSVAKAKAWFAEHTAQREQEAAAPNVAEQRARNEIGLAFESLHHRGALAPNGTSRNVGDTLVGVSVFNLRDADGFPVKRGTVGDITLTHRTGHHTFPFGQPSDPDNHETFEAAQAAAAARLVDLNG